MVLFLFGCQMGQSTDVESVSVSQPEGERSGFSDQVESSDWPSDFPAEQDLGLIFDTDDVAIVEAETLTPYGDSFLPYRWVTAVSRGYENTDVGDALDIENHYSEWRLVSMRIVPCAPLGVATSQDPDSFCWPMVRLVWQPVIQDLRLSWGITVDYADDRAIHALYPVQPRDSDGYMYTSQYREELAGYLKQGGLAKDISEAFYQEFSKERDATARWLLDQTFALRDPGLKTGSWSTLDLRSEWSSADEVADKFQNRLISFLGEVAHPDQLTELTSFSLPEGREPAHLDSWVFVAFEGIRGNIYPVDLQVFDVETGKELINMGPTQTVSMVTEDPIVQAAIDEGNSQLAAQVIANTDDLSTKTEAIADPEQFLVPNTSCASCHKLNDTRFDFHNFSFLEDRNITISPRVEKDISFDRNWVSQFLD